MTRRLPSMTAVAMGLALSTAGRLVHDFAEFGSPAPDAWVTGLLIPLGLAVAWWRLRAARLVLQWLLVAWALLHLVVGALLSVVPLSIWPFEPEQSMAHYAAHVAYGVGQIPLLWVAWPRRATEGPSRA